MVKQALSFVAAVVVALALSASSLQAQVIVDSHGFESPFFTTTFDGTGRLNGQPSPAGPDTWAISGAGGSTAVIQSSIFKSGSQAVRVDRAASSDMRWADPVSGIPSLSPAVITITWDMRVEQTISAGFGPLFGVEAYDAVDDFGLLGTLGVDASTGDVLFQDADTGFLTETGSFATFGAWHSYKMELDYATHQYRVYFDGALLDTIGFVDQNNVVGGLDHFSDADIAAISAGTDSLTGTAYFDNFVVTQVPEPSGILLGALSMVLLGARRRATH